MLRSAVFGIIFVFVAAFCPVRVRADSYPALRTSTYNRSDIDAGIGLKYGFMKFPSYQVGSNQSLAEGGRAVEVSPEWIAFEDYGKLGVGLDFLFYWQQHIVMQDRSGLATVNIYELTPFLAYYVDFLHRQFLIPFAKVGVNFGHVRQFEANSRRGDYRGLEWTIGVQFLLNVIDHASSRSLDRATGINNSYLTFEYANSNRLGSSNGSTNLEHSAIHLGLRFEI